jgi:signal transduction histidine kinase
MQEAVSILLVDDEQRNIDALEAILAEPYYRLLTATDADKALRLLLDNDVAVIVLDIKMPGVSGFELAKLIKGTKRFREIPILFLTAYMVEDQDVLAGYGAGAVDYLTKPVNPQILRQKVSVFAELFRKTRALAELNATLEARVLERTAELERSEAELRESAHQKDAFLATLAHELRNPLVPLRTGIDYLRRQPNQPPASAKVVDTMNRQLDHMVRLIDDLLDVARISRGVLELKCERFVLSDVANEAILDLKSVPAQRSLSVECSIDDGVMVYADRTRIRQILGNLLDNAVKYSPSGGTIRVELERAGDRVSVRVTDQGIGIPSDQLDRVFDMFTRVQRPETTKAGGLGLGLAIGRQLAEMHGGSLAVSSGGNGSGSTFTLTLPALEPAAESAAAREVPSGTTAKNDKLSVVLIEDNADVADVLALWLRDVGHSVQVAHDGLEGIEIVKSASPAVVLCDIGLPGIDGVEVCKRLKALALPDAPYMVALTGWGMRSDRERTKEAGFDQHLVKPVDMDKLSELLRLVATERAERARHAS